MCSTHESGRNHRNRGLETFDHSHHVSFNVNVTTLVLYPASWVCEWMSSSVLHQARKKTSSLHLHSGEMWFYILQASTWLRARQTVCMCAFKVNGTFVEMWAVLCSAMWNAAVSEDWQGWKSSLGMKSTLCLCEYVCGCVCVSSGISLRLCAL